MTTAILALAYLLLVVAFAGWATFRWMYRPWRMGGHSRTGRHLIRTADSMLALLGVSLVQAVFPLPMPVMAAVTLVVLVYLAWVAWERVAILRREQRARRDRDSEDVEDTV